uniref:Uncharacterized protein n=1 Tax=Solanum lycopersicum TaxID=4081 RepID=A0A3Q7FK16_SOLLC
MVPESSIVLENRSLHVTVSNSEIALRLKLSAAWTYKRALQPPSLVGRQLSQLCLNVLELVYK